MDGSKDDAVFKNCDEEEADHSDNEPVEVYDDNPDKEDFYGFEQIFILSFVPLKWLLSQSCYSFVCIVALHKEVTLW